MMIPRSPRNRLAQLLAAFACFCLAPFAMAAATPDQMVKSTTEEVIAVMSSTRDPARLAETAEARVAPHFDFTRMTRLAIGRGWAQATPEQQQTLEKEFSRLLIRTYSNALAAVSKSRLDLQVQPGRVDPADRETTVRTKVAQPGRQAIAINYQLARQGEEWKVFDVQVDGISLVANYRQMFADTVSRTGVDGLIRLLADKNRGAGGAR